MILQEFNINELAGATGLILGGISGLLVVVFRSRCHCKLNLCYICSCERIPPIEHNDTDEDEDEGKKKKKKIKKNDIERNISDDEDDEDSNIIDNKKP